MCVFCGSSVGARTAYADAAASLGHELAARGIGLVYGGAGVGLMRVVDGFYSPLLELFDQGVGEGFIRPEHRRLVLAASDPAVVLDVLAAWEPPSPTRKWVDGAVEQDRGPA